MASDTNDKPARKAQSEAPLVRRDIYTTPTISRRLSLELLRERQQARIRADKRKAESIESNVDTDKGMNTNGFITPASLARGVAGLRRSSAVPSAGTSSKLHTKANYTAQAMKEFSLADQSSIKRKAIPTSQKSDTPIAHLFMEAQQERQPAAATVPSEPETVITEDDVPLFSETVAKLTAPEKVEKATSSYDDTEGLPQSMSTSEAISFMSDFFTTAEDAIEPGEKCPPSSGATTSDAFCTALSSPAALQTRFPMAPKSSAAPSRYFARVEDASDT